MEETKPHLDISYHQMKPSVPAVAYNEFICWPKGPYGNSYTTHDIEKDCVFSPQMDCKALLLKTTSIQLTEHAEDELVPGTGVYGTGWYSEHEESSKH